MPWSPKLAKEGKRRAKRMAESAPPLDPRSVALAELLADLVREAGVPDLLPGARVVPTSDRSGLEAWATSRSLGAVRLGTIPADELERHAERIRLSRDRAAGDAEASAST